MSQFIRLNITAEGQTEEAFVKQTLSKYLGDFNLSTDVRCVLTSKDKRKHYRGGLISYSKAKKDIQAWLKEDNHSETRFTTMFDLYSLPSDFPGFDASKKILDPYKKVIYLESEFEKDINDFRFIPYIQLHEFEGLLFSDLNIYKEGFDDDEFLDYDYLVETVNEFDNPEMINDGKDTAPSKRLENKIFKRYDKVVYGSLIAELIGLDKIRTKCSGFDVWIKKLSEI